MFITLLFCICSQKPRSFFLYSWTFLFFFFFSVCCWHSFIFFLLLIIETKRREDMSLCLWVLQSTKFSVNRLISVIIIFFCHEKKNGSFFGLYCSFFFPILIFNFIFFYVVIDDMCMYDRCLCEGKMRRKRTK